MKEKELKKIINTYGEKNQFDMTIEECSELIQAICKYKRRGYILSSNLIEELADVKIMIKQLEIILNCKLEVDYVVNEKINRQLERIEKGE